MACLTCSIKCNRKWGYGKLLIEAECFIAANQVPNIRASVVFTCIAITLFINRTEISFEFRIFHIESSFSCKHCAISCNPSRQHTVKHIDPADRSVDQRVRRTDSHQISRFILRQERCCKFEYTIHDILRFTYRQSAYSISRKIKGNQVLRTLCPQIFIFSALYNTKQPLLALALVNAVIFISFILRILYWGLLMVPIFFGICVFIWFLYFLSLSLSSIWSSAFSSFWSPESASFSCSLSPCLLSWVSVWSVFSSSFSSLFWSSSPDGLLESSFISLLSFFSFDLM